MAGARRLPARLRPPSAPPRRAAPPALLLQQLQHRRVAPAQREVERRLPVPLLTGGVGVDLGRGEGRGAARQDTQAQ